MSEASGPETFGRVEDDGTVYVRTSTGERRVGQVPDVDSNQALQFFVRRYEALDTEVSLLEKRIGSGTLSPDEARKALKKASDNVTDANAVGDLEGLAKRLEALTPQIEALAENRRIERQQQNEQTAALKEDMVAAAQVIAESNDWRHGAQRFRQLLDDWKKLPRINRAVDDELWSRFSAARSTYSKRRKAHQLEDSQRKDQSRIKKEKIIERTRAVVDSTDWGATAATLRELMNEWKAAGSAQREVDDELWTQFRALQDQFYAARSAAFDAQDAEYEANQQAKEQLLDQAEAQILPIKDPDNARTQLNEFLTAYNDIGRVPRSAIRRLDERVRALESAVKKSVDEKWRRTDPEARKRAQDTVDTFSSQIAKLEKQIAQAQAKGDERTVKKLTDSIATYQQWLSQAQKALDEFSQD